MIADITDQLLDAMVKKPAWPQDRLLHLVRGIREEHPDLYIYGSLGDDSWLQFWSDVQLRSIPVTEPGPFPGPSPISVTTFGPDADQLGALNIELPLATMQEDVGRALGEELEERGIVVIWYHANGESVYEIERNKRRMIFPSWDSDAGEPDQNEPGMSISDIWYWSS